MTRPPHFLRVRNALGNAGGKGFLPRRFATITKSCPSALRCDTAHIGNNLSGLVFCSMSSQFQTRFESLQTHTQFVALFSPTASGYCTFEVYHIGVSASVVCVGVARTGFDLAIISCAIDWPLSCANSLEVQSTSSVWC